VTCGRGEMTLVKQYLDQTLKLETEKKKERKKGCWEQ
jgi:hypothetical protein